MRLLSVICQEFGSWAAWIKLGETVYIAMCSYAEKDIPKEAGFAFNKEKKMWFTNDFDKAALLSDYAEGDLYTELSARKVRLALSEEKSRCESSDIILRHPEKFNYYPFQYAGIDYMLHAFYENGSRRPIRGVILGDDMGLGKTVQIIGLWNNDESIKNCLIICPKTLKYNWFNEFKRWDVRGAKIGIGDTNIVPLPEHGFNVCIINYEAVVKQNKALSAVKWDLIGIDEAHNLKNEKSHRVKSIFGGSSKSKSGEEEKTKSYAPIEFDKVVFATGTPIPNRVMEMWPLITKCDPDRWNGNTMWKFISRYCGGNPKGAAADDKLNELQKILRKI